MKTPFEVIVLYLLPVIRCDLAMELVTSYKMKQADVGRLFGVTDAAISQYLKNKRGASVLVESSEYYPVLLEEIRKSAAAVQSDEKDVVLELCRLCHFARKIGLTTELFVAVTGCSKEYGETVIAGFDACMKDQIKSA